MLRVRTDFRLELKHFHVIVVTRDLSLPQPKVVYYALSLFYIN